MLTAAEPLFWSVSEMLAEAPRAMLPKAGAEGVMTSCDCVPTPASGALSGSVDAEVEMESAPLRGPVAVGVKVT